MTPFMVVILVAHLKVEVIGRLVVVRVLEQTGVLQ
jgi:hypothetical protein